HAQRRRAQGLRGRAGRARGRAPHDRRAPRRQGSDRREPVTPRRRARRAADEGRPHAHARRPDRRRDVGQHERRARGGRPRAQDFRRSDEVSRGDRSMKPTAKIAIVAAFVIAALAIVMFARGGGDKSGGSGKSAGGSATTSDPNTTAPPKTTSEIQVLYSTEEKDWIEAAAADFGKQHPEIKVTLAGKGSIDAEQ